MFGRVSGTVRNMTLDRATVNGMQSPWATQLGVLAGFNSGNIDNVHATNSSVMGSRNPHVVGGLVGNYFWGDISNSSFSGNVLGNAGSTAIGGLVGQVQDTPRAKQISNSAAHAYIAGGSYDNPANGTASAAWSAATLAPNCATCAAAARSRCSMPMPAWEGWSA